MDFKSRAQRECYERIVPWLKELFGEFAIPHDEIPVVGVFSGSAFAQVSVTPWGEDETVISTRAWVVSNVSLGPDLLYFLLKSNAEMRFGAFGVDETDTILFEHCIVGSTCDKNELRASVLAVVRTADSFDDEIIEKWGGERALERPR